MILYFLNNNTFPNYTHQCEHLWQSLFISVNSSPSVMCPKYDQRQDRTEPLKALARQRLRS